jgi:hypothetical protein
MPGMTESYLREKFGNALNGLATSAAPLWERVRNAMVVLLMFRPDDMPDKWSRDEFARLLYLSTDQEAEADEGQLNATLERMETEDVGELAGMIVQIHHHLLRRIDSTYAADQEPRAPV